MPGVGPLNHMPGMYHKPSFRAVPLLLRPACFAAFFFQGIFWTTNEILFQKKKNLLPIWAGLDLQDLQ